MKRGLKIDFNAPVILTFTLICALALALDWMTSGGSTSALFSVYRSSLLDPLGYIRLIGHVFGHAGWDHFVGNIMLLLLIGPLLEEKYGSLDIACTIIATALVTGLVQVILFPGTALLGASGIVFAFIIMSSLTDSKEGHLPLTFVLVAGIYLGREVYDALVMQDSVSQLTHIVGGLVGAGLGYSMNRLQRKRRRT